MRQASGFNRTGAIRILVHLLPKTELLNESLFIDIELDLARSIGAGNSAGRRESILWERIGGAVSTLALTNTSPETNRVTP
jgi:hypothetical protein